MNLWRPNHRQIDCERGQMNLRSDKMNLWRPKHRRIAGGRGQMNLWCGQMYLWRPNHRRIDCGRGQMYLWREIVGGGPQRSRMFAAPSPGQNTGESTMGVAIHISGAARETSGEQLSAVVLWQRSGMLVGLQPLSCEHTRANKQVANSKRLAKFSLLF